jgi:hypothetical protein
MGGGLAYSLSLLFIKAALGFYFLRVLVTPWQRRICGCMLGLCFIANVEGVLFAIFSCGVPISAYPRRLMEGKCDETGVRVQASMYAQGAANVLCDLVILGLPLPAILCSTLHWKTKISAVAVLMCAGM